MPGKNPLSTLNPKQKMIGGVVALVVVLILWQVYAVFAGNDGSTSAAPPPITDAAAKPPLPKPQQVAEAPKLKPDALTPLEAELMRLQQETQTKYLAALNELQMLKVERDIAESNKAIMSARLDTVKTQKDIINQLVPSGPAPDYAQALGGGQPVGAVPVQSIPPGARQIPMGAAQPQDIKYTVISVALLKSRWSAVLGYQGSLYNVYTGDILPPDGSKIVSISSAGVVLEKDGARKIISLIPII
ncbi:MAG: hypothetical protein JO149_06635 [Gammaproteobacteria bacterium]|nr:hypothetical protein [Gammaproteobacteria bacterium]